MDKIQHFAKAKFPQKGKLLVEKTLKMLSLYFILSIKYRFKITLNRGCSGKTKVFIALISVLMFLNL